MTLTVSAATARLGRELSSAHSAIDQALVATTALLHSAAVARADNPEVAPAMGQSALLRMHKSLGGLLGVRADMLRAHQSLRDEATEIMGPDEATCPPPAGIADMPERWAAA